MKKVILASLFLIFTASCSNIQQVADGTHMKNVQGERSNLCVFESRVYNVGSQIESAGYTHTCGYNRSISPSAIWITN